MTTTPQPLCPEQENTKPQKNFVDNQYGSSSIRLQIDRCETLIKFIYYNFMSMIRWMFWGHVVAV